MEKSTVLVAREEELAYIQVNGRGSFQNAGNLKRFAEEVAKQGPAKFVINLKNCTYMDSTFLGTMTGLGIQTKDSPLGRLRIINTSARNFELMESLGLDGLFEIHTTSVDSTPETMTEIEKEVETKEKTGENMLEAHHYLMQWDERNVAKFKDVVDYLKEDLGQTAEE